MRKTVIAVEDMTDAELEMLANRTLLPIVSGTYFADVFYRVLQSDGDIYLTNRWFGYDYENYMGTHGDDFTQLSYCALGQVVDAVITTHPLLDYYSEKQVDLPLFYGSVVGYNVATYGDFEEAVSMVNSIKTAIRRYE